MKGVQLETCVLLHFFFFTFFTRDNYVLKKFQKLKNYGQKFLVFLRGLSRRKPLDPEGEVSTFNRCLTTVDLVALGVGSTLGAGVYVLSGEVARTLAGPSIIISFFIAAVASIFSGLFYAELGARLPKIGSAYLYSYVALGEVWAFITGWNILFSCAIGISISAQAWSHTFDDLIGNVMSNYLSTHAPMILPGLAPYPDVFAAGLILILTGLLAFGVQESSIVNKIFTSINILILVFIIITGFIKGKLENWHITEETLLNVTAELKNLTSTVNGTSAFGVGGFFPYGIAGTLTGAATCFYAFMGFASITTTGEEVKNPQRSIPLSIVISLLFCFLAYFGVSAALTLMMPYYTLNIHSPLPVAFTYVGWNPAKYAVALGCFCALTTSLLGIMLSMPRVVFAMARDGLIFKPLCKVNSRKSPVVATLSCGGVAVIITLLFDLNMLVNMTLVGTLFPYTLAAICLLILRYQECESAEKDFVTQKSKFGFLKPPSYPTKMTSKTVSICIVTTIIMVLTLAILLIKAIRSLLLLEVWILVCVSVITVIILLITLVIWRQPQNPSKASFMVPVLPLFFVVSVFINIYMIVQMEANTWICYAVLMSVGLLIYFGYGVRHSVQKQRLLGNMETTEKTGQGDNL